MGWQLEWFSNAPFYLLPPLFHQKWKDHGALSPAVHDWLMMFLDHVLASSRVKFSARSWYSRMDPLTWNAGLYLSWQEQLEARPATDPCFVALLCWTIFGPQSIARWDCSLVLFKNLILILSCIQPIPGSCACGSALLVHDYQLDRFWTYD